MQDEASVNPNPRLELLKIKTNAHIKCESSNSGDFESENKEEHSIPYRGGPSMEWKGETCGFATTDSKLESSDSSTTLDATITVSNEFGGCCGRNDGKSKGGYGELEPVVTATLHLPRPDAGTWSLTLKLDVSQSAETGRITGGFNISLVNANDSSNTYVFPNTGTFPIPNIKPGIYKLTWSFPRMLRGCNGARFGTRSTSTMTGVLSLDCALTL